VLSTPEGLGWAAGADVAAADEAGADVAGADEADAVAPLLPAAVDCAADGLDAPPSPVLPAPPVCAWPQPARAMANAAIAAAIIAFAGLPFALSFIAFAGFPLEMSLIILPVSFRSYLLLLLLT